MKVFISSLLSAIIVLPAIASGAQIQTQGCDAWDGEPNRATVTVRVAPTNAGDTINSATMTGEMYTDDPTAFQNINVNCANIGGGVFRCQSSKTFGPLRTVTNVEYAISGQETLNGAPNQTAFNIQNQGVLCD